MRLNWLYHSVSIRRRRNWNLRPKDDGRSGPQGPLLPRDKLDCFGGSEWKNLTFDIHELILFFTCFVKLNGTKVNLPALPQTTSLFSILWNKPGKSLVLYGTSPKLCRKNMLPIFAWWNMPQLWKNSWSRNRREMWYMVFRKLVVFV